MIRVIRIIGAVLGTLAVFLVVALWWAGRPPRKPDGLSSKAIHFEPFGVPFTLHQTGYWLDCWLDQHTNEDRCRLTDVKGNQLFEDVFLPGDGQSPVSDSDLVFDRGRTGYTWTGSYEKGVHVPIIFLANSQILLPRSAYPEAKRRGGCSH